MPTDPSKLKQFQGGFKNATADKYSDSDTPAKGLLSDTGTLDEALKRRREQLAQTRLGTPEENEEGK